MKAREIWELSPQQIQARLDDAHAELFNLRFQFSIGQMRNSARLVQVRKDIARLNTILQAKQLQSMDEQGAR
jgi:large subunit ribosomal protein L29